MTMILHLSYLDGRTDAYFIENPPSSFDGILQFVPTDAAASWSRNEAIYGRPYDVPLVNLHSYYTTPWPPTSSIPRNSLEGASPNEL